MGLRSWFVRQAVAGAHVLVVEAPGGWLSRVAADQALVRRGWRAAASPADADVLLVCGPPGDRLTEAIEHIWEQLPGPRARVALLDPGAVDAALDGAVSVLLDDRQQRDDAFERAVDTDQDADAEQNHEGMDHGDMDHGDMAMAGPGGIPLASGGSDRDGLDMDVLHLPLGPVLPHWPPGLVLWTSLQGDVATEVEIELLDTEGSRSPERVSMSVRVARHCDSAAALLTLAGWDSSAAEASRARDALLAGASADRVAEAVERLRARVARSRVVRWSLRDLGHLGEEQLARHSLPEQLQGDVHTRLLRLLELARDELGSQAPVEPDPELSVVAAALPALVTGLDVAAVRLVVASVSPFATVWSVQKVPEESHG